MSIPRESLFQHPASPDTSCASRRSKTCVLRLFTTDSCRCASASRRDLPVARRKTDGVSSGRPLTVKRELCSTQPALNSTWELFQSIRCERIRQRRRYVVGSKSHRLVRPGAMPDRPVSWAVATFGEKTTAPSTNRNIQQIKMASFGDSGRAYSPRPEREQGPYRAICSNLLQKTVGGSTFRAQAPDNCSGFSYIRLGEFTKVPAGSRRTQAPWREYVAVFFTA